MDTWYLGLASVGVYRAVCLVVVGVLELSQIALPLEPFLCARIRWARRNGETVGTMRWKIPIDSDDLVLMIATLVSAAAITLALF
jgi:hypothetical protein